MVFTNPLTNFAILVSFMDYPFLVTPKGKELGNTVDAPRIGDELEFTVRAIKEWVPEIWQPCEIRDNRGINRVLRRHHRQVHSNPIEIAPRCRGERWPFETRRLVGLVDSHEDRATIIDRRDVRGLPGDLRVQIGGVRRTVDHPVVCADPTHANPENDGVECQQQQPTQAQQQSHTPATRAMRGNNTTLRSGSLRHRRKRQIIRVRRLRRC